MVDETGLNDRNNRVSERPFSGFYLFIWTLVECLITRWASALSASQWQLESCSLLLRSSPMYTTLNERLALHSAFFNIHWSGYSAVWLLHGWCHMSPRHVHFTTSKITNIQSTQYWYIHACVTSTPPPNTHTHAHTHARTHARSLTHTHTHTHTHKYTQSLYRSRRKYLNHTPVWVLPSSIPSARIGGALSEAIRTLPCLLMACLPGTAILLQHGKCTVSASSDSTHAPNHSLTLSTSSLLVHRSNDGKYYTALKPCRSSEWCYSSESLSFFSFEWYYSSKTLSFISFERYYSSETLSFISFEWELFYVPHGPLKTID